MGCWITFPLFIIKISFNLNLHADITFDVNTFRLLQSEVVAASLQTQAYMAHRTNSDVSTTLSNILHIPLSV